MEKLNLTTCIEEVKFFKKLVENPEVKNPKKSIFLSKKAFTSIILLLIFLPELLIYSGKIEDALFLYAGILAVLSLISIFLKDQEICNVCQALLLLPILRFVNFSIPVFSEVILLSFVFIYASMIIPITILAINQKFTYNQLGLKFKKIIYYFLLSIFIGLTLGHIEYSTIPATQLIPDLSIINILKLTIVMILFVGVIEEIVFRSILQTRLEEIYGSWSGLIFASLIFGLMNSGCGNLYKIFYAFFVGLLIGYLFQKTRSLPLIAMTHGFINIFAFGIIPHIKSEFVLF